MVNMNRAADLAAWDGAVAALDAAVAHLRSELAQGVLSDAAAVAHREAVAAVSRLRESAGSAAAGKHLERLRALHREGQQILGDLNQLRDSIAGELAGAVRESQTLRFLDSSDAGRKGREWAA